MSVTSPSACRIEVLEPEPVEPASSLSVDARRRLPFESKGSQASFHQREFRQRLARLSVPPKSVVKWVESMSRMSPARLFVGRQPEQAVELLVARGREGVRAIGVDQLPAQDMHRLRVPGGHFVMRQVQVEVEGRDVVQQPRLVEVSEGGQRRISFVPSPPPDAAPIG